MKRPLYLLCAPLLLAGCASHDNDLRQELADSLQRIADAIVEELRGADLAASEDRQIKEDLETSVALSSQVIDGTWESHITGGAIPCGDGTPCPFRRPTPADLNLANLIDDPVERQFTDIQEVPPTPLLPHLQYEFLPSHPDVHLAWATLQGAKQSGDSFDFVSLAGWMEHSMFLVNVYKDGGTYYAGDGTDYPVDDNTGVRILDDYFVEFFSLGTPTGTAPSRLSTTWSGAMIGNIAGTTNVHGDSIVSLNEDSSGDITVTVGFDNIIDVETGSVASIATRTWDNIRLYSDGSFWTYGLAGEFYGPGHKEAGGVFSNFGFRGAFGAALPPCMPIISCL